MGGGGPQGGEIKFDVSLVFTRLKALGFIKSFKLYDVLKAAGLRDRPCPSYWITPMWDRRAGTEPEQQTSYCQLHIQDALHSRMVFIEIWMGFWIVETSRVPL